MNDKKEGSSVPRAVALNASLGVDRVVTNAIGAMYAELASPGDIGEDIMGFA